MRTPASAERRARPLAPAKVSSQAARPSSGRRGRNRSAAADLACKCPPPPAALDFVSPRRGRLSVGRRVGGNGRPAAAALLSTPKPYRGKRTSLFHASQSPPPVSSAVPPGVPTHPAQDAVADMEPPEEEESIVKSTRTYLARLSLEDAVVALKRLQDLMAQHTAAVKAWHQHGIAPIALPPSPLHAHVDPFKLSKRPLEDIAEELCTQLCDLGTAYAAASAAERSLLSITRRSGACVPAAPHGPSVPVTAEVAVATPGSPTSAHLSVDVIATFGPMISSLLTTSTAPDVEFQICRSVDVDDTSCLMDVNKANPGPRIALKPVATPPSTQLNSATVSIPSSTFGDLVHTVSDNETMGSTILLASIPGARGRCSVCSVSTQTEPAGPLMSANDGAPPIAPVNILALNKPEPVVHHIRAAASTTENKLLHDYLRALETRLTEKQRREALREARGG